jgi:hypothetical protein
MALARVEAGTREEAALGVAVEVAVMWAWAEKTTRAMRQPGSNHRF